MQVDNVIGVPDSVIERPPDNIITSTITAAGQPQGSNFSEVGDMGLQRLSARNQDADYKEEQDPGDTKVRTFDWADAEQEGQSSVQPLWIIPCFQNPEGDDQAVQVRVSSKTLDGVLFSRFRHEYFTIPNWWSRFAKMHQVTAIKFVMVRAQHAHSRLQIRKIHGRTLLLEALTICSSGLRLEISRNSTSPTYARLMYGLQRRRRKSGSTSPARPRPYHS